jgi:uncharacterized protein YdaU (DUF1376 family)
MPKPKLSQPSRAGKSAAANTHSGARQRNLSWMPFYGDDFYASTVGWSPAQQGAYMKLLWLGWKAEACLPTDPLVLLRLAGLRYTKDLTPILAKLSQHPRAKDLFLTHHRLLAEYERAVALLGTSSPYGENRNSPMFSTRATNIRTNLEELEPSLSAETYPETQQVASRKVAPHVLPSGWVPDERCWLIAQQLKLSKEQTEKIAGDFTTYWWATQKRKVNWTSTWRNWCVAQRARLLGSAAVAASKRKGRPEGML